MTEFETTVLQMLGNLDSRMSNIETRLDKIETRIDNIETRLDKIESEIVIIQTDIAEIKEEATITRIANNSNGKELEDLIRNLKENKVIA